MLSASTAVARYPERILAIDVTALRFAALAAAMFIYALWGSPSPDHPGLPEIMIGAGLALAAGFPAAAKAMTPDFTQPAWRGIAGALLIYGLAIAVPVGVMQGNETAMIARDLPPFLFLLLPLLMGDIFEKRPDFFRPFLWLFVFLGLMFSFRSLFETSVFNPHLNQDTRELYYFANSPAVLVAGVLPVGYAGEKYLRTLSLRSLLVAACAVLLAGLPLLAMVLTLQRATIAWMFFAFGLFAIRGCWQAPLRTLFVLCLAGAALAGVWGHAAHVFDLLAHKTEIYGVNKRGMEIAAVWDAVAYDPFFGLGWGGTFESPAVGGVRINYTHSFVSGMILKTGLCGFALAVFYIAGFFKTVVRLTFTDTVLAIALTGPLAIDTVLYASYKWLDFGLLLLLIHAAGQLHRQAGYCIHKE